MLIEEGVVERRGDHWFAHAEAANVRVPDSVEALIRARLDTLPSPERRVLQAASVVGRIFQQSAVAAIAPPDKADRIEAHLEDAILRDLITDERAPDEPTFRFRHILIRDVAYATLPKARRADLHLRRRRLAACLGRRSHRRVRRDRGLSPRAGGQAATRADRPRDPGRKRTGRGGADGERPEGRRTRRRTRRAGLRGARPGARPGQRESSGSRLRSCRWIRCEASASGGGRATWPSRSRVMRMRQGRSDIEGRAIFAQAADIWIGSKLPMPDRRSPSCERARKLLIEAGNDWYLVNVLEFVGYGPLVVRRPGRSREDLDRDARHRARQWLVQPRGRGDDADRAGFAARSEIVAVNGSCWRTRCSSPSAAPAA